MRFLKKPSKKAIIITVIVLAIGGIVFASTRPKKITYETATTDRGNVVHEVTVTGSISPFKKIELQPEASGRVAKVYVTEGAEVKAGAVLIDIDARDVSARVASQRASLDSAKARLAELVAGATPQELALAENAVTTAQTKLDSAKAAKIDADTAYANALSKVDVQAEAKVDAMLLGYADAYTAAKDAIEQSTSAMFTNSDFLTFSTTSSIAQDSATSSRTAAKARLVDLASIIAQAKATGSANAALSVYASAVADVVAVKTHLEADRTVLGYAPSLSSTTLASYQASVGSALSSVDASLQALSADKAALELQDRLNDSEINSAKSAQTNAVFAVQSAENALVQAKTDLAIKKTGSRSETIASQRAMVAAEEATLSGLYADLSKRRIIAPLDSVVTDISVSVGETASPGKAVVTLNAHGKFEIIANVSEVDISRVKLGQPVDITLDAFSEADHWSGKVGFIDPAEKVVEGVIFYETKFVFDQEDERLRSGMTANLSIETERADSAIRVPLRALKEKDNKSFVDVLVNGAPEEREITIGVEDDEFAEVRSGLTEGETVVTGSSETK